MKSKKLYKVYSIKDIPKIWKLAEKEHDSSNLIGVSHCSSKSLVDYTIWLGDVNNFIKDKNYIKYQFSINDNLSNNIANIYKELVKNFKVSTIIENSQNNKHLNVYYIIKGE